MTEFTIIPATGTALPAAPFHARHLIDGIWQDSADGATSDRLSPSHGVIVSRAAKGGKAEAEAAIVAVRRAVDDGRWRRLSGKALAAATIDGAGCFRIFWRILLPVSGPIAVVSVIWQFTNIWNDFLFGDSFGGTSQPMTVALNNLVQSSTGVKEYNVHFDSTILAALPTLLVYIVAGRHFGRGLMAGSVNS